MKKTPRKLIALIIALLVCIVAAVPASAADPDDKAKVKTMIDKTAEFLIENADVLENSDFDLLTLGLLQSGASVPDGYMNTYLAYIKENLTEILAKDNNEGRIIYISLALTAAGLNPESFEGKNLLAPLSTLADITDDMYSAPYALMLLDNGYADFTGAGATTRAGLISWLMGQLDSTDGGYRPDWGYGAELDADTTGLIICALWPHRTQTGVQKAIDDAIAALSDTAVQDTDGGYFSYGTKSPESAARVLAALCTAGKNPANAENGFVKAGGNPFTSLSSFYIAETGGFYSPYGEPDEPNSFSTRDGLMAIAAYSRLLNGKATVYTMDNAGLADEITALIGALPETITASDIAAVDSAKYKYDALPGYLKTYITNSGKLSAAVTAANTLRNTSTTSTPSSTISSNQIQDPIPPTGNGEFPVMVFAMLAICGIAVLLAHKAGNQT